MICRRIFDGNRLASRLLWFDHMKSVVVVAVLSFAGVSRAAPTYTVEVGPQLGSIDRFLTAGVGFAATQLLAQAEGIALWSREDVSANVLTGILDSGNGALYRGTAGLDVHLGCDDTARPFCLLLGAGVGYQRGDFEGREFAIFEPGDPISFHDRRGIFKFRLGIDVGGDTVRVLPAIEIIASPGHSTDGQLGGGVAFAW